MMDRLVYQNITIPSIDVTSWSLLELFKGFIRHDRQTVMPEYYHPPNDITSWSPLESFKGFIGHDRQTDIPEYYNVAH